MPKMVLNRTEVFVSNLGLSYDFQEGVPTEVSPKVVKEALRFGATIDKTDVTAVAVNDKIVAKEAAEAAEREPKIREAIKTLLKRNMSGDFTAGGKPNLNQVMKLAKLSVTTDEVEPIWKQISAELQNS